MLVFKDAGCQARPNSFQKASSGRAPRVDFIGKTPPPTQHLHLGTGKHKKGTKQQPAGGVKATTASYMAIKGRDM